MKKLLSIVVTLVLLSATSCDQNSSSRKFRVQIMELDNNSGVLAATPFTKVVMLDSSYNVSDTVKIGGDISPKFYLVKEKVN